MATFRPEVTGLSEVVITCDSRFTGAATVSWRDRTKKKRTVKIAAALMRSLCVLIPVPEKKAAPAAPTPIASTPPDDSVVPGEVDESENPDDDDALDDDDVSDDASAV